MNIEVLDRILKTEGGYVNDSTDRGGETFCGVSRHNWPGWRGWLVVDEQKPDGTPKLTPQLKGMLATFYRENFWDRLHCESFSASLAYEVFDMAVNLGVGRTGALLQEALNLLNRNEKSWEEIAQDGQVGPKTLAVLRVALNSAGGEAHLQRVLAALQGEHYLKLVRRQPKQERFLRGWLKRA
ncbi:hypothetical protein DRQ50_00160 [bacterium]|nr:MAG: hypothetical protein DRQ50_00160 [bacterium]RKZ72439.1 MAG: hypothetical protein DRQ48_00070 [Gammaproteobacteria bacterium]